MLIFKPITIQVKEEIESYLLKENSYFCNYCFVDIFIWRDLHQTEYCLKDNSLFIRKKSIINQRPIYSAPIGDRNITESITYILKDAKQKKIPAIITTISEKQKRELESTFPNQFTFKKLRDSADYIYRSDDLIHLKGNKYHAKRNYINRFLKIYKNRWSYENIEESNKKEVLSFYNEWYSKNRIEKKSTKINQNATIENDAYFKGEKFAIKYALEHFTPLDLRGGLLRLDNRIIAFTLGSQCTDEMFVIQIEKADRDIRGAYQMINQQFAMANCVNIPLINREEDLGIVGLRKAKLSYYPAFLGMKYEAKLT